MHQQSSNVTTALFWRSIALWTVLTLFHGCTPSPFVILEQQSIPPAQWMPSSASWDISGQVITATTRSYDDLLALNTFIPSIAPWSLEVRLRGRRAGIYFSLDQPTSKRTSHMVRFDETTILAGYFNGGGEYTATSTFASPADPSTECLLRVDVDPRAHSYSVFVNDSFVGTDTNLVFPSGYPGLQASDGNAEFRSLRIIRRADIPSDPARRPGDVFDLAHVRFIEVHGTDPCVYDPESGLWLRLDAEGTILGTHKADGIPSQSSLRAETGGRTFLLDGRSMIVMDAPGVVHDTVRGRFGSPEAIVAHGGSVFVSDPGVNAILEFDGNGTFIQYHDAEDIGGFLSPGGMALMADGSLTVADYDKIVFVDRAGSRRTLVRTVTDDRSMSLTMEGKTALDTVTVEQSGGQPGIRRTGPQSYTLTGLHPLQTYRYRFGPAMGTIPSHSGQSQWLAFTTPPEDPARRAYRQLDLLYVVYRTINYRDSYPATAFPRIPDGRTLTDDDIAYLRQATEFNREFYFRNSGCRLLLDFDFFVVEDTLWLSDVGDHDPYWLEPRDRVVRDVERAASSFGKAPSDYDGTLCTYAWLNYPPRRTSALRDPSASAEDSIRIRQAYGGGTYGVPAPWTYGSTAGYTGNPFQDRFSRQDWLITHEFHHQLDALMYASGYPAYYHADQPWKMPGAFGEDFNFNAAILRAADPEAWLSLSFGSLKTFVDADHDGVPDDDPSLPFDERRLGGDPRETDTDRDGKPDLAEVMAGSEHGTSLRSADSDGDGLDDAADPQPLYSIDPSIIRTPTDASPLPLFAAATLGSTQTSIFAGWTTEALTFEVRTSDPVNILLQVDGLGDGWFHGFDNIQLRIATEGDSVFVADYYLRDCASWVDPPHDRRDILNVDELRFSAQRVHVATVPSLSESIVRFSIPAHPTYGLDWSEGKTLALRFGIQQKADLWVWDELLERNAMIPVSLH